MLEHIEAIDNLIEKVNTQINSGQLDDVRRSRMAAHGEQLEEFKNQVISGNYLESDIEPHLKKFKESLNTI